MRISDWSSDVCSSDLRLAERRATIAGNLSGGEQQMLALGAALLTQPRILIIDEPPLGLAVPVIEALCEKLSQLRKMLALTLVIALAETGWVSQLRSEEQTSELPSLQRISYDVLCLNKNTAQQSLITTIRTNKTI